MVDISKVKWFLKTPVCWLGQVDLALLFGENWFLWCHLRCIISMDDDKFYSRIPHIHFPTDSPPSIPSIHPSVSAMLLFFCIPVSMYLCIFESFRGDNLSVFALWLFLSCAHCRRQNSLDLPFCLDFFRSSTPSTANTYSSFLVSGIVILIITSPGKLGCWEVW